MMLESADVEKFFTRMTSTGVFGATAETDASSVSGPDGKPVAAQMAAFE
jgi:hypothetical protein